MNTSRRPNAIELTVEQAWYLAEVLDAGSFPWVLAITPPYSDPTEAAEFRADQSDELTALGVLGADGRVHDTVAQWVHTVCRADGWLDLRFVTGVGDILRGVVARRDGRTVVALRNAELITLTAMDIDHPQALVPVLAAGLANRPPAQFATFALPARAGARADERIRNGADLSEVLEFLGIPQSARPVVEAAFDQRRSYVEIVAGERANGNQISTEVGVSIVDTDLGRVLVSPEQAFDGEWVSTFEPGTTTSIAAAVERLIATLPGGTWFPHLSRARDFDYRTEMQRRGPCPTTL
ncbi:ESX secretion-associated protein EspG [Mycolicibacterium thermoresistibile]